MTRETPAAGATPAAVPTGYGGIRGGIGDLLDAARQTATRGLQRAVD